MTLDADAITVQIDRMSIAGPIPDSAVMSMIKGLLENSTSVVYTEEVNNSFTVIHTESNCCAGVSLKGGNMLKVMLEQADVAPLQHARGHMTISSPTITLRFDGQTMLVQKTRNQYGDHMVRFVQPLTEDGVDKCVKLILAVFARAEKLPIDPIM